MKINVLQKLKIFYYCTELPLTKSNWQIGNHIKYKPVPQIGLMVRQKITLKAFEIVALMRSRMKPPDIVPSIPQTIVIPPNIISAFLCQGLIFMGISTTYISVIRLQLYFYIKEKLLLGPKRKRVQRWRDNKISS